MTHWWVSMPHCTCLVVVDVAGRLHRSSAPYVWRNTGQAWDAWLAGQRRSWGNALRVVELKKTEGKACTS